MKKNYKRWHEIKECINDDEKRLSFFMEGEIWWTYYGANIGSEQDGKGTLFMRPILILKKFNKNLYWGAPLSQKVHHGNYFFPLLSKQNIIRTVSFLQMKAMDAKRLINKIDTISTAEMTFVKEKITALLQ